jgi:cytochrome c biogenesis protein CcdA
MLVVLGVVLLSAPLQERFAVATSGFGNGANSLIARIAPSGLSGQFLIGVILGAVWSPCVGPTLGAASVLASQGKNLLAVAAVMIAFGIGAAVPLVAIGTLSRETMKRWRGRMLTAGGTGKLALGGASLAIAALILTGADRLLEAVLVDVFPAWLTALTTRF